MIKKIIILGPLPPAIGGIATIIELLKNEFKADGTFHFINTIKLANKRTRFTRPLKLLIRIFLTAKSNKNGVALMFSSAHSSFWEKCMWCCILRFFGVKTVVYMVAGDFPQYYAALSKRTKSIIQQLVKNIDIIATQSPLWQTYYKSIFPKSNIQIVNPGINTDFFVPSKLKIINTPIKLLYTGWLIKDKGIYDLLNAIAILSEKKITYKLSIVGPDFGNQKNIKEYAIKLKIDTNIEFRGLLASSKELLESYQNADIFVFPSHFEGFPYALMEAVACGLPCVGTRVGGVPDILNNGKNGILVTPKSPTEFAEGIRELIKDEWYRRDIGILARAHVVSNYSISKSINDFKKVLNINDI